MKKYTLSTIISLCCIINTMQLQTSQQSSTQDSAESKPLKKEHSNPLVAKNIDSGRSPESLQPYIKELVQHYYTISNDPNVIARKVFKKLLTFYRIDDSARVDVKQIIHKEITPFFQREPNEDELKMFIHTQIKNYHNVIKDITTVKRIVEKRILETFNMSGPTRDPMRLFADSQINNAIADLTPNQTIPAASTSKPTQKTPPPPVATTAFTNVKSFRSLSDL